MIHVDARSIVTRTLSDKIQLFIVKNFGARSKKEAQNRYFAIFRYFVTRLNKDAQKVTQ